MKRGVSIFFCVLLICSFAIFASAAIIQQPVDYYGRMGDTATFSVAVDDDMSSIISSYTWYYSTDGGSKWSTITMNNKPTLSVVINDANLQRVYYCKVNTGTNTYSSDIVRIVLEADPPEPTIIYPSVPPPETAPQIPPASAGGDPASKEVHNALRGVLGWIGSVVSSFVSGSLSGLLPVGLILVAVRLLFGVRGLFHDRLHD